MNRVPILFDYSFGVRSRRDGFVARVSIKNGRILAALEDGGWGRFSTA